MRGWTRDRGFALSVAAGLALMSVEYVRRVLLHMGHATNGDGLSGILIALTYLCLLGAGVLVVLRHAPSDKGGVIDAAVVGIAGGGPLWEFLLRPRLQAQGVSSGQQVVMLVEIFALLAYVGALGRISATIGRARFSLRGLYLSTAAALVGFVFSVITTDQAAGDRAGWISLVWMVCYLSLGATILHPYSSSLTFPETCREPTLSFGKLAALGAVLTVLPLAGSAPQLAGHPADGLLIAVGTLVAVPLVLLRIGQLIAQRAADQRALAQLAAHDDLTGLPNRRTMMALLDRALNDGALNDGALNSGALNSGALNSGALNDGALNDGALNDPIAGPVTVLYCDLDGFKPINDTYGHRAGDEVLRVVAQRLQHCVRAGDAVGRLGGDEFLVICRGLTPHEATALQARIEHAVGEPIAWEGHHLSAGVTVGLASGTAGLATDTLIAEADQQMYASKRTRVRTA
jgi:diguanylate cyclase (GGDEF)-like protein